MIFSPLEQFKVNKLINLNLGFVDLSLTNGALSLLIFLGLVFLLQFFLTEKDNFSNRSWFFLWAQVYKLVLSLIVDNAGKKGLVYFPLVLTLFLAILLLNLIGAVPYSFTITAHASLTFSISFSIWLGTVLLALQLHGLNFFSMFLPANTPNALILLLVFVELGSYLIKPFSLGIRLAANLTAGHLLLNLGASFLYFLLGTKFVVIA